VKFGLQTEQVLIRDLCKPNTSQPQILVNQGLLYSLLSKYIHSFSVIKNTSCIGT